MRKRRYRKLPYICLSVIICSCTLTGCWDRTEVNDLAISIAASVDSAGDNQIRYSKQIALPGQMGEGGSQSSGGVKGKGYTVVSAVGPNMKDAMQYIQMKLSRRLFYAHRRLFLIGEPLAEKGIKNVIDEMSRNPGTRLRTNVVITRGRAMDYLQIDYPFERVPAEALRKTLYGPQSNFKMDIKELMVMLSTQGAEALIPIISLQEKSPGESQTFKADGLAVLLHGRMVGSLSTRETEGVLWLRNQIKRNTVSVSVPDYDGDLSMDLLRVKSNFKVKLSNGRPTMLVKLRPEVDVIENDTTLNLNDPKNIEKAQQAYSEKVKSLIEQTLDLLQHRYHADVIKFGDRVHHAYPKLWKSLAPNWEEEFSQMPVTIEVDCKIRRIGMTGNSTTREENEAEK